MLKIHVPNDGKRRNFSAAATDTDLLMSGRREGTEVSSIDGAICNECELSDQEEEEEEEEEGELQEGSC